MTARSRTITWEDPHTLAEIGRSHSGLDYLKKLIAGELPPPPIARLMNFTLTEIDQGRAVFEIKVNFIRAIAANTGTIRCKANVIHAGSRTATAEGKVFDSQRRIVAHGTTTCLISR